MASLSNKGEGREAYEDGEASCLRRWGFRSYLV